MLHDRHELCGGWYAKKKVVGLDLQILGLLDVIFIVGGMHCDV